MDTLTYVRRALSLPDAEVSGWTGADEGSVVLSTDRFMWMMSCTQYVASALSSAIWCRRASSPGDSSSGVCLCPLRHRRIWRIASGNRTEVQY